MLKNMRFQIQQVVKTTALIVAAGLMVQSLPSWAGFNPRNREARRPGNRRPGGTRSDCKTDTTPPLTPLVPASNWGLTISPYPTFHWYMPTGNNHPRAEFALYKVTNADKIETEGFVREEEEVYSTQFQINQQSGIASLTLPSESTLSPLDVGQAYYWQVKLLCPDETGEDYVVSQYVEGWVTRVNPSAGLAEKLAQAQPVARIDLFAEDGLWNDALTQLTTLQRIHPEDQQLKQEWTALFNSEYVNLSEIPPKLIAQPE
ncbi:MAG: DUF928 domain-containing protein [Thermosynechococcaceae cyanobacterium]